MKIAHVCKETVVVSLTFKELGLVRAMAGSVPWHAREFRDAICLYRDIIAAGDETGDVRSPLYRAIHGTN
jgi:hypothetical protein